RPRDQQVSPATRSAHQGLLNGRSLQPSQELSISRAPESIRPARHASMVLLDALHRLGILCPVLRAGAQVSEAVRSGMASSDIRAFGLAQLGRPADIVAD